MISKDPLYVIFTMDCERILSQSPLGGPIDWAASAESIASFCTRLLDRGYPPVLFLKPSCARQHTQMLLDFQSGGAELALHIHPQCFADYKYDKFFGEYDHCQQRQILSEGLAMLTDTLQCPVPSFRPGNWSANDQTYGVLSELGFAQVSISDPGRISPQFAACWEGAYPYPHYGNKDNRLIPGDLDVLEVPLTTNPNKRFASSGFPHELRLEQGTFDEHHKPIIEYALANMQRDDCEFKILCIFTHNNQDYGNADDKVTRTLEHLLNYLDSLNENYNVRGLTLDAFHAYFKGIHYV